MGSDPRASIGSSSLPVGDAKDQCTIKLLMLQFQTVKLGKFVFASKTVDAPTVQLIANMARITVVLGQVQESLSDEKKIHFNCYLKSNFNYLFQNLIQHWLVLYRLCLI